MFPNLRHKYEGKRANKLTGEEEWIGKTRDR